MKDREQRWIDGLSRGIPPGFPEELLDDIEGAWQRLGTAYGYVQLTPTILDELERRLEPFETFHIHKGFSLLDAWEVHDATTTFVLCIATQIIPEPVGVEMTFVARHESRMVGLFELQENAGTAMIRPESFNDSVLELLRRRELDFPKSSQFCRSYYVVASDEPSLRKGLPKDLLDQLGTKSDLFVEVCDTDMVVFWGTVTSGESIIEACDFFSTVSDILGPKMPGQRGPYR